MSPRAIVVDWGTSAFRAYLVDAGSGRCLDSITGGVGMRALADGDFAGYCRRRLAHWRKGRPPPPVYLSGMVGSRQGWCEAPQPPLPLDPDGLARHLTQAPGLDGAWLLPGVRWHGRDGEVDVMRGEEVQIFGALALRQTEGGWLCLPGTHSKWAAVRAGTLERFSTVMTGELYEAIVEHTLIGQPAVGPSPATGDAFLRGLQQADRPGGLMHRLFSARGRWLYGDLDAADIRNYVSALLIGSEVAGMRQLYPAARHVLLVCGETLREPYRQALAHFEVAADWVDARDASLAGVLEVVRRHRG